MDIEIKIMMTFALLWVIFHCTAMPGTKFANWGTNKFGDYGRFLNIIMLIFLLPVVLVGLVYIWTIL